MPQADNPIPTRMVPTGTTAEVIFLLLRFKIDGTSSVSVFELRGGRAALFTQCLRLQRLVGQLCRE